MATCGKGRGRFSGGHTTARGDADAGQHGDIETLIDALEHYVRFR
jgi:hypothetical protein